MSSHVCNLRLATKIRRANTLANIPCNCCFFKNYKCYIMPNNSSRLKCSECTCSGKPCVNMTWSSLDRTREEYKEKVQANETLLATVIPRLLRNKKVLKQANERAKRKALCMALEMINAGELETAEVVDCPLINAFHSLSVLATLGYIKDSFAINSIPSAVPGSS